MISKNKNDREDIAYYFYTYYHKNGNISQYMKGFPILAKKKSIHDNTVFLNQKVFASYNEYNNPDLN